jgi:hypothetical protein
MGDPGLSQHIALETILALRSDDVVLQRLPEMPALTTDTGPMDASAARRRVLYVQTGRDTAVRVHRQRDRITEHLAAGRPVTAFWAPSSTGVSVAARMAAPPALSATRMASMVKGAVPRRFGTLTRTLFPPAETYITWRSFWSLNVLAGGVTAPDGC